MYESVLDAVLKTYGIQPKKVHAFQKGYRNEIWPIETVDGVMLSVVFFKREDGILERVRRTDQVSEYLADAGLPTRRRVNKLLKLKTPTRTVYAGVYTYLPGNTIPWEAYTMNHLKLLGKTMSDIHALLADMPDANLPSVYDEYTDIFQRVRQYFTSSQVADAMRRKLNVTIEPGVLDDTLNLLSRGGRTDPQQALHMDFVRGNVLFGGPTIPELVLGDIHLSGILDFEKTAWGSPILDIARTLAFLLVDCKYKRAQKIYKYFLYSGYIKRGATTMQIDTELLESYVTLFLLHDFYKFLRHNPYESLAANEHYVRTRDILHERNMIRYP
jgi:Ser/Thr protein kinase RdoA (MazF antagonist)